MLAFVLIFTANPYAHAEEEDTSLTFHAPTVRQMIEANLSTGNTDEEFFHAIANVYLADPVMFAELIADLTEEEIEFLARGISYDLQKTERTELAVLAEHDDPVVDSVLCFINEEIDNTANASLDSLEGILETSMDVTVEVSETLTTAPPDADQLSIADILVDAPVPGSSEVDIFDATSANVTIRTYLTTTSSRTFIIQLYKRWLNPDTGSYSSFYATYCQVVLPANKTTVTATIPIEYYNTGVYQLYAVVRDTSGTVVATSVYGDSIVVSGQWKITVELPKDRHYKGTLTLYNAEGKSLHSCICLGLSVSNDDPSIVDGNTPTGECLGYLGGTSSNTKSYGLYRVIKLIPVSGDIKDYSYRDGFLIHGGDPEGEVGVSWAPLNQTNGCIRITNDDQGVLETLITDLVENYHETKGIVSISEIDNE